MLDLITGFHIEPTNICTLKCSGCARTRFIDQWPQHWKNQNLNIDALLTFLDVNLTDKKILLSGNYGDPIYHPDFIDFIKKIKLRGAILTIITNGSYKKQEWWEDLVSNLDDTDTITFSVDGTPENFTEYRVNADWASIRLGMDIVAKASCNSAWKYIPFAFNQSNIEQVEKLSQDIGIKKFWVEFSDRFDEKTKTLMPDTSLLGSRYSKQVEWKLTNRETKLNPKCDSGKEHFITADGYYSSCCRLADHRFYYKTPFGKNKKSYAIDQHTLTEILQREQTIEFYQNLDQQPGCQYNCPSTVG
jgi:MoaA/NifB/PqqE/SkfB family radical SAM enzyme